jgi:uncharacterized protein (DUF488 family)
MVENEMRTIRTIGYENRSFTEFTACLKENNVSCIVDVRSKPVEPADHDYTRSRLEELLARNGIDYVFMGDTLGGIPDDLSVYRDGKVSYPRLRQTSYFQRGIKQLIRMIEKDSGLGLLCFEAKPENCHRARLVGTELVKLGIQPMHIDEDGELITHEQVLSRLRGPNS